jgi:iron complex transport system permease protein
MPEAVGTVKQPRSAPGLAAIWLASAGVLLACALAAFRLRFAEDVAALLAINGPRVLVAAAAGAALALAGALRQRVGVERPLRELAGLAISAGAAGGGFALATRTALPPPLAFVLGAGVGAAVAWLCVRALDRPRRATNLGASAVLVVAIAIAALAGSYARARSDFVAPAVAWLLGDLGGASFASGALLLGGAAALVAAAAREPASGGRGLALAALSLGLGVGAAGPLAFVGGMVPRAVRALSAGASGPAWLAASAAAGAATVAAVDAVPRLLVGGYDFPWNVPAGMLALPIFLGWNRARLRREAGPAGRAFEAFEVAWIAALTLGAAALAVVLTRVVRAAT